MRAPALDGIRVLELGNFMAGPYAGTLLADMGADVVKVEPPDGGDHSRALGPFPAPGADGAGFLRLNRNKRGIALDLKAEEGHRVFRRLAERADVIVENLRPGVMQKLGLGYAALKASNPSLVYVSASGWGQDGPLKDQPGMDIMAQARSGLMSITGMPDGDPVKVGVPITDLVCALYGALAAVAALVMVGGQRTRT